MVARQVLRGMREAQLLSPHRSVMGEARTHEGTIVTDAPSEMWGTDELRAPTVENGLVWIFTAVEHWNAEVMGCYVSVRGDRFAALEPIKQGLERIGRGMGRDAARCLSLRLDQGTQHTSEHFHNETLYWGLELSFGYVAEPETNSVAERFNRPLKEQVICGRIFRNVEERRAALNDFIAKCNDQWLVAKNGFKSPNAARVLRQEPIAA